MHEIKLIILLETLNKEEFRRLGKFLHSPFYNYSKPVITLYEALRRHYPSFDSPKLTQENIWRKVFPSAPFQANKFWQLTSKLTRIVEQFLIAIELESHPREEEKLLVSALAERDKKLFKKEVSNIEKRIEKKREEKSTYLHESFFHLYEITNYHGLFDTSEAIRYEEEFLAKLDSFYFSHKLKTAINLRSVEKHRNLNYSFYLISEILDLVEQKNFEDFPHLEVFALLFVLVDKGDADFYWEVKEAFLKRIDSFNREDKKFIFHQFINFTIPEISKGSERFRRENFELYKTILSHGLLVERKVISDKIFTSIISNGAIFKEFEWTKKFLNNYSKYLPPTVRQDACALGNGYILFFEKKIPEAIELLLDYPFKNSIDTIRAKGLLIRSYFELFLKDRTYYDFFNSYSKSFEKYLHRDFIESEKRKMAYLNFIRILKKIVQLKNSNKFSSVTKEKIKDRIKQEALILKPWLTKRLENL